MLTDVAVRKAKAQDKDYKLFDSGGLYLFVAKTGSKSWRLKYRFAKKEKVLTIGPYPLVSLKEAREAGDEAKKLLAKGIDPAIEKKRRQASRVAEADVTLEKVSREWHEVSKGRWSEKHAHDVLYTLERDVFPMIGALPITHVTAPIMLTCLQAIEKRGAIETAHRVRQRVSDVFVYGIAKGICENDPAAIVKGALKPVVRTGKMPAITTLDGVREVLVRSEAMPASPVTKLALRFLALTFVRPGVLRFTPWEEINEIDPREDVWRIPAERMKLRMDRKEDDKFDFLAIVTPQLKEVIAALRPLTGRCPFVFPSARHPHRPMSENTVNAYLKRAGFYGEHVPHGWRSAFSTIMNERHPHDRHIIDLMLAHSPKDKVEAAYNRALHMERRRELAHEWANMLMEGLPPAASLLEGKRRLG